MQDLGKILLSILTAFLLILGFTRAMYGQLQFGIDCGIIASKMDILTDNGMGEYKRLSDLYIKKGCPLVEVERIRTM